MRQLLEVYRCPNFKEGARGGPDTDLLYGCVADWIQRRIIIGSQLVGAPMEQGVVFFVGITP